MRIAYVLVWRGGRETGPFKKIAAQAAAWTELGAEVGLFVATTPNALPEWSALPSVRLAVSPRSGPLSRADERRRMVDCVLGWRPDVVYQRHGLFLPALATLTRAAPTVLEVNGNDAVEYRYASYAKHVYHQLTRRQQLRSAAGMVYVTRELSELPRYRSFGRPGVVVTNSLDLAELPQLPASAAARPRLFAMGHVESRANGVDQLLRLAHARPGWDFDVVGMVGGEAAPPNVTVHPGGPPERYRPLLARADVGIGDLSLWRLGLEEASALRVREYLGCGVPALIGYRDSDFIEAVPHLLAVPNRDGGVMDSLDQVDEFVERWRGRRVPRESVAHLDIRVKERARLDFLAQVADRSSRS